MGGLDLEPDLARRAPDLDAGWRMGAAEAEAAASALGYVARLTERLANLLDVPLRYPLRFGGSRSAVYSCPPPAGDLGCARCCCCCCRPFSGPADVSTAPCVEHK